MVKYAIGDTVRVKKDESLHGFPVGTYITLLGRYGKKDAWKAQRKYETTDHSKERGITEGEIEKVLA